MLLHYGSPAGSSTSSSDTPAVSRSGFDALLAQNAELTRQLEWFKKQLIGSKSERQLETNPHQKHTRPKKTITYQRGVGPKVRPDDCVSDTGLRFDDSVPQKTITLPVLELQGYPQISSN